MKVLQFGKFYPIKGGVEKVAFDLMSGLSEYGIKCDMMCASIDGSQTTEINENAKLICCKSLFKYAATMISPSMINKFKKECEIGRASCRERVSPPAYISADAFPL